MAACNGQRSNGSCTPAFLRFTRGRSGDIGSKVQVRILSHMCTSHMRSMVQRSHAVSSRISKWGSGSGTSLILYTRADLHLGRSRLAAKGETAGPTCPRPEARSEAWKPRIEQHLTDPRRHRALAPRADGRSFDPADAQEERESQREGEEPDHELASLATAWATFPSQMRSPCSVSLPSSPSCFTR